MTLENKKYTSEIHKRAFNETTKKLYDEKFSSSDKKITVKKYYGGGWATEKMSDNTESSFTNFDDYFKYILNSIEPNEFTQAY